MGKRELVALLSLSSWGLVMAVGLLLAMPWVCLRFVNVVFPDHTHLPFLTCILLYIYMNPVHSCIQKISRKPFIGWDRTHVLGMYRQE